MVLGADARGAIAILMEPGDPVVPEEKRGFTKKVLEYLRDTKAELKCYSCDYCRGDYCSGRVTAEQLLKIAEMVPPENLEDRQNEAPKFADFVEVARREPRAPFEIYIITHVRPDERVTVDGALIPADRQDLLDWLLSRALGEPDERSAVKLGDREYVRVWWD
jgi:hypothetical protein